MKFQLAVGNSFYKEEFLVPPQIHYTVYKEYTNETLYMETVFSPGVLKRNDPTSPGTLRRIDPTFPDTLSHIDPTFSGTLRRIDPTFPDPQVP
jgi:hypothetical protein